MLTPAFRRRLFLHQDGFILGMILGTLQPRQIMSLLSSETPLTVGELARRSRANPAYLHVALRCLAQQGWLQRHGRPGTHDLTYRLTATGQAVAPLFSLYGDLAGFLRRHLPLEKSLLNGHAPDPDGEFSQWVTRARDGWFADRELVDVPPLVRDQIRHHLDGHLVLPIMLALWNLDYLASPPQPSSAGFVQALRLLEHLRWYDPQRGDWTNDGRIACAHALHYGMVGSYHPMLVELSSLVFGDRSHRTHNTDQEEWHVDRRLNVLASSAAHRRYFVDADEIFIDIFNRAPLGEQPAFVADNGCGDGSWLRHIYTVVSQQTERGQHLAEFPLLMVGADYNATARDVARKALADAAVPSLVLFGDITDPDRFAHDLRNHGLDIRDGLHIRAFIDHNRRYQPPQQKAARDLPDLSTGAYVDDSGQPIPNRLVEQDLIAFLQRWVPYVDKHGLVLLEAHCVEPRVAARHQGEVHNIVFDTYHGFSLQYPIDFEVFMEAAHAAGLQPILYHQNRYPSRRPFVSICNNYFTVPKNEAPIPNGAARRTREGGWEPSGREDVADGEALHHLIYRDGDLRRPKSWCANATALLLRRAIAQIERKLDRIRDGREPREIAVMDYGTGTGFAVIELLKICRERGLLAQLDALGVELTINMLDIPSGWFAKGYELLKDCRYVRFASIRSLDSGAFLPLPTVVHGKPMDLVIASMVFHLIPRHALPRLFRDLAAVLRPDGRLIWHAPDIGPAPADAALFHEPNRRLRLAVLRLLQDSSGLTALLDRLPAGERRAYDDLPRLLTDLGRRLTPQDRAAAQAAADRQILPVANDLTTTVHGLAQLFDGETFTKTFEMRPADSVQAMLIPSNQRYLPEIDDLDARRRLTTLLMQYQIMPALCEGAAGTAYGFSLHWTFGEYTRKPQPGF